MYTNNKRTCKAREMGKYYITQLTDGPTESPTLSRTNFITHRILFLRGWNFFSYKAENEHTFQKNHYSKIVNFFENYTSLRGKLY